MYIDTTTFENMLKTTIDFLRVTDCQLTDFFKDLNNRCRQNAYIDGVLLSDEIDLFVQQHLPQKEINEILLYHLGRRLNNADNDYMGHNLFTLLTTETKIANYLQEHGVEFSQISTHLEIIYEGVPVSLEDTRQEGVCYLRSRLGYNEGREDYCFNGFILKDLLYKNNYARALYWGPEFICQLSRFLKRPDIASDYFNQSTYYCYKYCLPIEKIVFDKYDNLNLEKKVMYLLNQIMQRLFEYKTSESSKYIFDNDNPIIRMKDNDTALDSYFISREIITAEMLR